MNSSQLRRINFLVYMKVIIISNLIGMTWSTISLSPSVIDVVRYVNESYIVTCIDGAKRHVKWWKMKNKKVIDEKGHPHLLNVNMGTALVFERISVADRGQYMCQVGEESTSFKLIVISPISFTDTPSIQVAQEYRTAVVKCNVQGDPKPKILWKFDGKDIGTPKYELIQGGLEIKNVTLEDKGIYICRAYQVSPVTSMFEEKKILLNIQHKPMVPKNLPSNQQYEIFSYLGGEINLTCEAIAEPPANFTWYRQHNKTVTGRFIKGPHASILQLFILNKSLFGSYKCKATNNIGSVSQIFTLHKGIKPPKPSLVRFHAATSDSFSIEVMGPDLNHTRITTKMLPYALQVHYRVKGERVKWNETATVKSEFTDNGDIITIHGLQHNTKYEVRVATRNLAGLSDLTPVLQCRTLGIQADSVTATAVFLAFRNSWITLVCAITFCVYTKT